MASAPATVLPLGEIEVGRTAVCFAILRSREEKLTKRGDPYQVCHFRAGQAERTTKVWKDSPFFEFFADAPPGGHYRLRIQAEDRDKSYGSDFKILEVEPAGPEHADEGYDPDGLFPSSEIPREKLWDDLLKLVQEQIGNPFLLKLIGVLLRENRVLFMAMPAAKSFHHAYNAGLLEHVWSLTKICSWLADHYAEYYGDLDPPLDKELLLTSAIVHDIGKLRELAYDSFDVSYTVEGQLIGHIVLGRDMVREAAARVPDFPGELLLLLEHAILSHHGRLEFASPVVPKTLEALILSFADDLDAKVNAAVKAFAAARGESEFTEPVRPLDNRTLYRRLPAAEPLKKEEV
ncbi:MAG: HD domain-containing protein [Isosphaeraceae bacterium]|nr:HD domain-containing protein [Isosphaeraceae bacterium]